MLKWIGLMLVGVVTFTAAAAGSWWWRQQQTTAAHAEDVETSVAQPHAPAASGGEAVPMTGPAADAALPVAVRPRPMSVEELLRYGLSLNARDESLKLREDEFRQREARMQLILADIQSEQGVINGLRGQVQQQLEAADALLAKIQQGRQSLADEQARAKAQIDEFKSTQHEMDDQERENIKRLATWVRAMDPTNAGEVLREMANDGRMATAVKILSNLEEREAAKILDSLSDSALIDSFIREYQKLRSPIKKTSARR